MKRDIKLQKLGAHTSIWLGKRESDQNIKSLWCPKSQRLTHQNEILKISGIDLKMRCVDTNRSNVMSNMKPNEKLQRYCIQAFVGGHICIFL